MLLLAEGIEEKAKIERIAKIEKIAITFSEMLEKLGEYLSSVGRIEKDDKEYFEFMKRVKEDPAVFAKLIDNMGEPYSSELLGIFLRMTMLSNKIKNVDDMLPEEKIRIGGELIAIGKKMHELFNKIRGKVK